MKRSRIKFFLFCTIACLLANPLARGEPSAKKCKDYEIQKNTQEDTDMPPRSIMMDQLYGQDEANKVFNRLQTLDPQLNLEIQRVAYDHFWARPGLNLATKSYVTVVSLIALQKEEQIRIHLNGFLNSGGDVNQLKATLALIVKLGFRDSAKKGLNALNEVISSRSGQLNHLQPTELDLDSLEQFQINQTDKAYAEIIIHTAKGDLSLLAQSISEYIKAGGSIQVIKDTFMHQIVYCGFPASMNGFAVLLNTVKEPQHEEN